jgi:CBS domain containing-hemolysin-like protein
MVRPVNQQSQHFQSLSLTILAIATAAIGFGLFGVDFPTIAGLPDLEGPARFWAALKLICGAGGMISYASVLVAVGKILTQDSPVTGRQATLGPLLLMGVVMVFVALIFIIGVFEEPSKVTQEAAGK